MIEKKDPFLEKFANRIETMGKDGVIGLIKHTKNPINSYVPRKNLGIRRRYRENQVLRSVIFPQRRVSNEEVKTNNLLRSVDYGDYVYTPYSFHDYQKLPKEVKLGGLGPSIGGEEWAEKQLRRLKMSEYGEKVLSRVKCKNKTCENLIEEREKEKKDYLNKVNSGNIHSFRPKLYKASKTIQPLQDPYYGRRPTITKIFRSEENKAIQEEMDENYQLYLSRLNKIKTSLIH